MTFEDLTLLLVRPCSPDGTVVGKDVFKIWFQPEYSYYPTKSSGSEDYGSIKGVVYACEKGRKKVLYQLNI